MAEKFKTSKEKLTSVRNWRKLDTNRKRMNRFITGYIEAKYNEIYKESIEAYYSMKAKHPDVTNLTTTKTYKNLIRQIRKTTTTKQSEPEQPVQNDNEAEQRVQDVQHGNILTRAVQESIESNNIDHLDNEEIA